MGIQATLTTAIAVDGVVRTGNVVRSEGHRQVWRRQIPADQTNYTLAATFAAADIEMLWIKSSRNCNLKTNNGTTPDDELELNEGEPIGWASGQGVVCPITTDVTEFFVDTGSGGTTLLEIEAIIDPSP